MIGQTISHYKILEKLGEGGMGVVYKAKHLKLDSFVALKFLPPHLVTQKDAKKRFIHEAKAASSLDHPNICTIHDIDETADGRMFIVMAFYKGETLQQKIEAGPLAVDDTLEIIVDVASGLVKAHDKGIVHRDIKPANIMVTEDRQVKILDFGVAKLATQTQLTNTGSTPGTAAYMSPEQAVGRKVDQRSDVFSLGVVLYELLTGKSPFEAELQAAVTYRIANEDPEPLRRHRADAPDGFQEVVDRALCKDADARYQSMSEMLADLKKLQKEVLLVRLGGNDHLERVKVEAEGGPEVRSIWSRLLSAKSLPDLKRTEYALQAYLSKNPDAVDGLHLRDQIRLALLRFQEETERLPSGRFWLLRKPPGTTAKRGLSLMAVLVLGIIGFAIVPTLVRRSESPSPFVIAVTPFWGQNAEAMDEGKAMQVLVERRIKEELGEKKDARILGKEINDIPRSHEEAKALGEALGATVVMWGEVLVLRDEVDIQPYMTIAAPESPTGIVSFGALQLSRAEPNQMEIRKAKAKEIGIVVLEVAATYYRRRATLEEAERFFERAVAADPQGAAHHYNEAGLKFQAAGRLDRAREKYQKAIAIDPEYGAAYNNLATLALEDGDSIRAVVLLDKALLLGSDAWLNAPLLYNLADLRLGMQDSTRAQLYFLRAIEENPSFLYAHNNLGALLIGSNRIEEAKAILDDALARLSNQRVDDASIEIVEPYLLKNRGKVSARLGRQDEAFDYWTQAVAKIPDNVELHRLLGGWQERNGSLEKAREHWAKVLELSNGEDREVAQKALKRLGR